ncbi:DNA modification methylase [candidate division WWE3 bacterium]|jgi:DNA modification methylase|nr:DNA modification methylase [candidate division WWE3 bacterium]MBT7349317.1 DNA modification methylase [candidate division WWE3 bacterium]
MEIKNIEASRLKSATYNPRTWSKEAIKDLTESIKKFGIVDPIIVNSAPKRENIVIGGHFRLKIAKDLKYKTVPVYYISIPDVEKEKELNLRLNKNTGDWDLKLLAEFDERFLSNVGFDSENLDEIFGLEDTPEEFDLKKELAKLNIHNITIKKGDVYALGESRLMCGDSTIEKDMLKLMGSARADMCLTDPPYILDYLKGKKKAGKPVTGFGAKRDRRYLETDELPDDFTEKWVANIAKVQKESFSIIVYENWKNIRIVWGELERYWKVKNMIVWHLPNRTQGFASKRRFFSKHDIAMVGTSPDVDIPYNLDLEEDGLQNEYETALYAISGKPHWESYKKGKKYQPTDFIEYVASDEKSSGQGVIFGTKPIEILIPYIKVLTKRDDLIVEPFGGSGSTLIAATKMKRRCYLMEKSPIYAEVIKKRWENLTGEKGVKIA